MSNEKISFTDDELLTYGIQAGFVFNEKNSLLTTGKLRKSDNLLFARTQMNETYKYITDYTIGTFMNPGYALRAFYMEADGFIGFRVAYPGDYKKNDAYAILVNSYNGSYAITEKEETLEKILFELSGFKKEKQEKAVAFQVAPLELLVILAACDVVLQGRYQSEWFTENSLLNAYDLDGESAYTKVCGSIAQVAEDFIYQMYRQEEVEKIITELVENKILIQSVLDEQTVYAFQEEYSYLPEIFKKVQKQLALFQYQEDQEPELIYLITIDSGTWSLKITRKSGIVEKPDSDRMAQLLQLIHRK